MSSSESRRGRAKQRDMGSGNPAELVALVLALEERDALDERDRRRLDREIGARLVPDPSTGANAALLHAWLGEAPSPALVERIERVRSSLSLLRGMLLAFGLFLGWAAASALLQFEVHAGRINIVLCLGLLVLLPFTFLLLACLGALLSRRAAAKGSGPGLRRLAATRLTLRILPRSVRQDVEIFLGRMTAHTRIHGEAQRAQLFVWSQWVGVAFAAGALLATLAFVVFTDLAFGWSTTLDVGAESVHRIVSIAAKPWAAFWPDAAPSLDLVESTRHFRVAGAAGGAAGSDAEHIHFVDPILYGGWWPFLVAALLFYGLVPRIIVLIGGQRWLVTEVRRSMLRIPGVDRLLDRLTQPLIETQATGPEEAIGEANSGLVPVVALADWVARWAGREPVVVRWAEASTDEALAQAFDRPGLSIRDAGGRRTLSEDEALANRCAESEGGVALCVRAYEPPVLDVLDFLAALRRSIGMDRGLLVLLQAGSTADHEAWRHKLIGLGDPGLVVATLVGVGQGPAADVAGGSAGSSVFGDATGPASESSLEGKVRE